MGIPSVNATNPANQTAKSDRGALLLLTLVMLLALGCRLYHLVPLDVGLLYAQDADEGVYATTAQLALQGYVPYRDFFTPMPPVAIYLFMIVLRIFYHPWGSATGLMALRYASVAYGLVTVLLTYSAAKMIGGKWAGLLAAVLIAVDGIVVAQDRRAMLEAPTNMFSILAILCYLHALHQARQPRLQSAVWSRHYLLVAASGLFCTLALLVKGTALVPVLVVALAIVVRRRWREGVWFAASLVGSYLLCALVFLVLCPADYLKQNYIFHLLRPWDGTVHPLARLTEIWNYTWSWATVRFALGGVAATLLAGRQVRNRDLWLVVLAWAGLMVALLLGSRTYWATYFSQLAVPFGILGGLLLNGELDHAVPSPLAYLPVASRRSWHLLQAIALAAILVLGCSRLRTQYTTTKAALERIKPAYVEIVAYINEQLPPDSAILAFETNYTFLSSHPPAGADEGSFFIDSYGEMLYRNLYIPDMSISALLAVWRQQDRIGTRAVFFRKPAQIEVRSVFTHTPYTILDGRALKQLTEDTSSHILDHTQLLKSAYAAELRVRTPDGGAEKGAAGQ